METETVAAAGLLALTGQDALGRLLGPSADYVGQRMKGLIEKCDVNVDRVFQKAWQMLGPRLQDDGSVAPRVLKGVIDEAMFCDDELTASYLGGVLASSRTEAGRDDRGVRYLALVESLSSYELRAHFLMYSALALAENRGKREMDGPWPNPYSCTMAFTEKSLIDAMEYADGEDHAAIARHVFVGLNAQKLCDEGLDVISRWNEPQEPPTPFRFIFPTRHGFMLFLWGSGMGQLCPSSYFDLEPDRVPRMVRELDVLTVAHSRVGWHHEGGGSSPEPNASTHYRGSW